MSHILSVRIDIVRRAHLPSHTHPAVARVLVAPHVPGLVLTLALVLPIPTTIGHVAHPIPTPISPPVSTPTRSASTRSTGVKHGAKHLPRRERVRHAVVGEKVGSGKARPSFTTGRERWRPAHLGREERGDLEADIAGECSGVERETVVYTGTKISSDSASAGIVGPVCGGLAVTYTTLPAGTAIPAIIVIVIVTAIPIAAVSAARGEGGALICVLPVRNAINRSLALALTLTLIPPLARLIVRVLKVHINPAVPIHGYSPRKIVMLLPQRVSARHLALLIVLLMLMLTRGTVPLTLSRHTGRH